MIQRKFGSYLSLCTQFYDLIRPEPPVNVRLYDDFSFLIDMLKTVGFREIRMMNPFDKKSAPDMDATSIVYECRK